MTGRVFEQKQNVADATFFAQFDQALLQAQAGSVIDRCRVGGRRSKAFATNLTDQKESKESS